MALVVGCAPAAAADVAVDGANWVDGYGRRMDITVGEKLAEPAARSTADMVGLFSRMCLTTLAKTPAIDAAATSAGLTAKPYMFPLPRRGQATPATLKLWRGAGVVVSQSDGAAPVETPQCDTTFYVPALPDAAAVTDAITAMLGKSPSNAAAATKSNGKPARWYNPEWSAHAPDGSSWTIQAFLIPSEMIAHVAKVQFAIRASNEKAN